jgi:hypothetical protein
MAEPSFNDLALFAEKQIIKSVTIAQVGLFGSALFTVIFAATPVHKAWFLLPISASAASLMSSLKHEARSQSAKRAIAEKIGIEITRRKLEGQL